MPKDFVGSSSRQLDAEIQSATSVEDIRLAAKNHMASQGILDAHRDGNFSVRENVTVQASPESGYRYQREFVREINGKRMLVTLSANTVETLDEMQKQVS